MAVWKAYILALEVHQVAIAVVFTCTSYNAISCTTTSILTLPFLLAELALPSRMCTAAAIVST